MRARRVSDAAPLRFLLAIVGVWVILRGVVLIGWQAPNATARAASHPARPMRESGIQIALDATSGADAGAGWTDVDTTTAIAPSRAGAIMAGNSITVALDDAGADAPSRSTALAPVQLAVLAERPPGGSTYQRAGGEAAIAALAPRPSVSGSHWSGSVWAFLRGGGRATPLSPGGQIGGGQAGARLLYRLRPGGRLALSARVSRTIGGIRQSEAAVGFDWQPVASVPVHLTAERRIAIDRGGRNAWTLGAAGGLYAIPLGGHWRFDGYAEAGVVGARRRDLYADGAARVARAIDLGDGRSLALGGGLWAAAQPRTARVDIGPTAVLRLPVARHNVALALDWREQVAGHARPHSGIAFTAGVDF